MYCIQKKGGEGDAELSAEATVGSSGNWDFQAQTGPELPCVTEDDLEPLFFLLPTSQVLGFPTWATILGSFWLLLLLFRQILLCGPGCSEAHGNPPASASQVLESQVCSAMPGLGFLSSPDYLLSFSQLKREGGEVLLCNKEPSS